MTALLVDGQTLQEVPTHRAHGTRAKYVIERCHCAPCTEANRVYARYQAKRKRLEGLARPTGPWAPPFVDAAAAVRHVRALGAIGVGYKRVAQLAGVSHTALAGLLAGQRHRVRVETARKVLALPLVPDVAPGQLVPAAETWELIGLILHDTGWSKARLARELGQAGPGLQIGADRVLRRTARHVEELARRLCVDLR